MQFTVEQVASMINGEIVGDKTLTINNISKIEEGQTGCITFLSNTKYESFIYTTKASAVIVNRSFVPSKPVDATLICVDDAYLALATLLDFYQKLIKGAPQGIEQPSFVGQGTTLGEQLYLGAFAYIGKNCKIGTNVKIYPQAYIGDNVTIGNNTAIHSGVKIYSNTQIGSHCALFANVVVGCDGFGFAPQPDGTYKSVPQLGNVIIEDHVSIGSNSTIDCATMGSTIIRSGVKIDNLVQVAHNVEIGKNTVIAAQTAIAGSTKIGENCVFGGQVGVSGHIKVANKTTVGAQSGVNRNILEEGTSLNGTPVMPLQKSLRANATYRRLPEIDHKIKELEKLFSNASGSSLA